MRRWAVVVLGVILEGCGGSIDRPETEISGLPPGESDGGAGEDAGGLPPMTSDPRMLPDADAPEQARPDAGGDEPFLDPGCPDVPRAPGPTECDPFATVTGCVAGERCVPIVEYADDCGTEQFGTVCAAAGTGVQGDGCETEPCAAGHVCVTTGQGSQCVRLCRRSNGGDDCAPGLVCQPLDVDGFFVCF